MLIPLRPGELQRLIPAVATGTQFLYTFGDLRNTLQRLLIATIGGAITLLISQSQIASRWSSIWLVIGVISLLYILWGPIVEAARRNALLRRYPAAAIFEGEVADLYIRDKIESRREQANQQGELELIENRRTWMILELADEEGDLASLQFPMEKRHSSIQPGMLIRCLVFSERKDFMHVSALSDAWIPRLRMWVGDYPYLLKPAFEELCGLRLKLPVR
ncbi:putative membrane protein [cyanobiont of Ornithocercus magnificus]|nr:putative membrane protein [cyanobiont of Ornithocercus magnificus]